MSACVALLDPWAAGAPLLSAAGAHQVSLYRSLSTALREHPLENHAVSEKSGRENKQESS